MSVVGFATGNHPDAMAHYDDEPPPATDRGDQAPLSQAEARDLLDVLATCPDGFVTFQDHDALEANDAPSNHCMPAATYGFPASHLAAVLGRLATRGRTRGDAYHTDWYGFVRRPFAFTFRLEGHVVDDGYDGFLADAARLLGTPKGASYAAALSNWVDQRKDDGIDHKRIFWALERAVDADLGAVDVRGFRCHPSKPAAWRDAFLAAGIAAFVDRHSFMTGDLWQQVAVFDLGALRDVTRHDNPCCLTAPLPAP